MKYSISALSDNLCSKSFESFANFLSQGMMRENPDFKDYLKDHTMITRESVERFISFCDLISILRFLKTRKDFVIESEIVKDFQKGHHINQDYGFTLKTPFPITYINFDDPVEVEIAIPENYFDGFMDNDYNEWIENKVKEKMVVIKNLLHGILIVSDPKVFREMKDSTVNMQEHGKKVMHEDSFQYYKTMNPEKTFKVYFILDDLRLKEEYKKQSEGKVNEKVNAILRKSYEYTNILFDSEKLPNFISEFGLGVINLNEKGRDELSKCLCKLLDITIQIINFINSNDYVEQAPMWKSQKSKEHYEKKFNMALPPEFYMLRVKYPKEFMTRNGEGQSHSPYGYQFDVRGHWRHLRSPVYKQKRGAVIWIPNFKKGHGLYIQKRYDVVSEPDKLTQDHLKVEKVEQ
jgi:hypothetical protein